jgi:hypothetical protein
MKRNHHLLIRSIFQLSLIASLIFFLQGCFCKDCAMAVSQKETPQSTSQQSVVNSHNTVGSLQQDDEIYAPALPVNLPRQETSQTSAVVEEVAISVKTASVPGEIFSSRSVASGNDPAVTDTKVNEAFYSVAIEKFIPKKFVTGKSCPLGIQSISSQIMAGPNLSFKSSKEGNDVYGSNSHKHQPGPGFQLGWGLDLGFSEKFSVSPAVLLKQNNASEKIKYSYTEPGSVPGESTDKYSYTSLSMPVVANYQLGKQVQVFAGPEVNYLLKASVKSKGANGSDNKENITKNSVKVGVGVQAGVKYKIPSGSGDSPFGIQLLYEHRLSRLNKKNQDGYGSYTSPAWNMRGFQLGVTCSMCELMKARN